MDLMSLAECFSRTLINCFIKSILIKYATGKTFLKSVKTIEGTKNPRRSCGFITPKTLIKFVFFTQKCVS